MAKIAKNVTGGIRWSLERPSKDPVKTTALIYLKEALVRERYEDCGEFIRIAEEFGATRAEIRNLLEDPKRSPG